MAVRQESVHFGMHCLNCEKVTMYQLKIVYRDFQWYKIVQLHFLLQYVPGYLDDSFVADDDVDSDATLSMSEEEEEDELSDCSSE